MDSAHSVEIQYKQDRANTSVTACQKMLSSYMMGKIKNIKISTGQGDRNASVVYKRKRRSIRKDMDKKNTVQFHYFADNEGALRNKHKPKSSL